MTGATQILGRSGYKESRPTRRRHAGGARSGDFGEQVWGDSGERHHRRPRPTDVSPAGRGKTTLPPRPTTHGPGTANNPQAPCCRGPRARPVPAACHRARGSPLARSAATIDSPFAVVPRSLLRADVLLVNLALALARRPTLVSQGRRPTGRAFQAAPREAEPEDSRARVRRHETLWRPGWR